MEDKLTTSTGSATTPSPISALVLGHVTVKEELRDLDESPLMQQQQQQSLDLQQQQQQQQMVLLNSNTIHVVPRRRPYVRSTNRSQAETCVCEVCQGELSRFEALLQHKLLHFNSSHVCYVCDSYFVSVENLLLHMTGVHREIMGSYPKGDAFVCPVCVQRFSSSKSLLVHQSLHSPSNKQEDFSCTICSVDLHSCRGLLAHLGSSRHKEMKIKIQSIFICIDCRSVFANRDSYAFHMMMRAQNEVCDSSHNNHNDNNNLMLSSKNSSSSNSNNNNNSNSNSGNNNCYNRLSDRKSSSATPGDDIKPSPPQPVFPQQNFMTNAEGLQHSPFLKTSESSSDQLTNPYQRQQHKQQEHLQQQQQQQLRQLKSPNNPSSSDPHSSFLSADTSKMSNFPSNASYVPSIQQQFQQRQLFLDELMSWNALVNARGLSALASRGNLVANQQLLAAFSDTNNLSLVAGKLGKKRLESFVSPTRFDGKIGSDGRNLEGATMNDHNNRHSISLQQRQLLSHQQNLINLWMQRFDCELSNLSGSTDNKQHEQFRKRQSEIDLQRFDSVDNPAEHKPRGLRLKEEEEEEEEEDCNANADQSSDVTTNNNNNDDDEDDDGEVFSSDEESKCPSSDARTQKSTPSVKSHPIKVKSSENKSSQVNLALGKSKHIKVAVKKKQKYLQAAKKRLDSSEKKHSDNGISKRKRKLSNTYSDDGSGVDKEVEKVDKTSRKMLPLDSKKAKTRKSLTKIKASESLTKALKWKEKSKKRLWRSASSTSFTTPECFGPVPVKRPRSLEVMDGVKNKKLSLGKHLYYGNLKQSSHGNMMLRVGDNFHLVDKQNLFAKKFSKQNIFNANLQAGSGSKMFDINDKCIESDNCAKIPEMRSDIFLNEHKLYADGELGKACQERNKFLLRGRHLSDLGVDEVDIDSLLNISTAGGQDVFGSHESFVQRRERMAEQGLADIRQNTISQLTQASFLPSSRNFSASPQEEHHPLNLSLPCLSSTIKRQDKSEADFDSQKQFLQFALPSAGRISINTMSAEELGKHYELVSKHFLQRKGTGTPVDGTGGILNIVPGDHDRDEGSTKVTRVESPGDDDIVEFVKVNRSRLSMCKHCGLIFSDKLVFYLHMGLHNLNDPWQCNLCGKICSNLQEFSSHVIHY